ncbi:cytochrome P450, partial [Streptomyces sp. NPDC047072]|uniref:cytochrome P450 n=1 Tax=Streptomyces sp. NPDC047072 TaxID=3154809 RepID=UPI0033D0620C
RSRCWHLCPRPRPCAKQRWTDGATTPSPASTARHAESTHLTPRGPPSGRTTGLRGHDLAFLILFAGYENTVQLIGNAVLGLLQHPAQLAALRADPARLPAAVEEFARFEGPALLAIRRFATEDVTIGDVTVPAGETVLLSLAAANRDPARFPDPDRLDLGRDASGHLALGHGVHYCLGAPLARAETEIALAALLERFPDLRLAAPDLDWRPSLRARGLRSLPVTYSEKNLSPHR